MRGFVIAALLLTVGSAEAAELRVDAATGDDSASYADVAAGTASWASIGRAAWGSTDRSAPNASEAVQPGDVVIVAEGIYETTQTSGERFEPAYNPVNGSDSASEAERIVFRAEGLVQLRAPHQPGGPIIGTNGRNYITWDGFYIDEQYNNSRPDSGPVVVWASDYGEILNCTILGDPDPLENWSGQVDNHNGIRIENTHYTVIRGNHIAGFNHAGNGTPTRNAAGIMTYDSQFMLIENNEITDNCTGVYIKGSFFIDQIGLTFRYNHVHDNTQRGIELLILTGERSRVYQNVVENNPTGMQLVGLQGGPSNVDIVNNTFHDNDYGMSWSVGIEQNSQGNRLRNNIVTGGTTAFYHEGNDTSHLDSQHHCLFGQTDVTAIDYQDRTLAEWKSQTGEDQLPPETSEQDPLFVDAAAGNLRLQASSPCRESGVDLLDLDGDGLTDDPIPAGAYITGDEMIGPSGGGGPIGGNGGNGGSGGEGGAVGVGGSSEGGAAMGGGEENAADDPLAPADGASCSCDLGARGAGGGWFVTLLAALALSRRRRS